MHLDALDIRVIYDNNAMETTAKLYALAAANIYSNIHKRFTKIDSDIYDFTHFTVNNIEYKWLEQHRLQPKLFLQPIYNAIANDENTYNPCHIPRCSQALVTQQQFSDGMQRLFAHRHARDVIIKKKHQGITATTQILSRVAFTAETAANRNQQGMYICTAIILKELFNHMNDF